MKKSYLFIALILTISIMLIIIITINKRIHQENPVHIGLNNTIEFLETCIEQSKLPSINVSEEYLACTHGPDIPLEGDLEKLRLLKDLKGINICKRTREESSCILSDYSSKNCEEIFNINYQSMGVRPCPESIFIYECEDEYYYYHSYIAIAGPPDTQIYKIQLDNQIVEKLKE